MNVLGLPLEEVISLYESEGYKVVCTEVRSKKGVPDGNDKRVIRVRRDDAAKAVFLAYSVFKTSV